MIFVEIFFYQIFNALRFFSFFHYCSGKKNEKGWTFLNTAKKVRKVKSLSLFKLYLAAKVTSCQRLSRRLRFWLFNQPFCPQGARSNVKCSSPATHRQTPTLNCAGVRKGRELGPVSASLCDTRSRWCCSNDTSVGRNLFRRLTRFPALSWEAHECSFDTLPAN